MSPTAELNERVARQSVVNTGVQLGPSTRVVNSLVQLVCSTQVAADSLYTGRSTRLFNSPVQLEF